MTPAYYNENDPHAAEWLRNLICAGVLPPGIVDERSIEDVRPSDLAGFRHCHFFAGIGVWPYALRLAGVPDDAEVWTGSCPCQPFSAAGKRTGVADERHLWPAWEWLIAQRRPRRVYGEQVASKDGLAWLDLVCADMEGKGYAVGAGDLCAAGFGAPHIRQRLVFVADAELLGCYTRLAGDGRRQIGAGCKDGQVDDRRRSLDRVADAEGERLSGRQDDGDGRRRQLASGSGCSSGGLADPASGVGRDGELQRGGELGFEPQDGRARERDQRPGPTNGFWRDADWLGCTDGFWRPVMPGTFPLVDGAAFRLGSGRADLEGKSRAKMLRGYGNAIVPQMIAEFVSAAEAFFASEAA